MSLNLKRHDDDQAELLPLAGHNSGVTDWAELLDLETISMSLDVEYGHLKGKKDKLMTAYDTLVARFADGLKSDDDVAKVNDIGAQMKAQAKLVDGTREIVKGPFFKADKAVQQFFRNIGEPLEAGVKKLESKISEYNRKKAAEAKRLADEEAARRREEANRLAAAAESSMSQDVLEEAINAEAEAGKAEKAAAGPVANFTRTRGNFGMSSSSIKYVFEVEDLSLVPREYFILDEAKVKRAINGKDRIEAIPGLKIIDEMKSTIRG